MHPEYSKNPFYVFGESYAGKYIPSLTHYILTQNKLNPPLEINLQGLAMGGTFRCYHKLPLIKIFRRMGRPIYSNWKLRRIFVFTWTYW